MERGWRSAETHRRGRGRGRGHSYYCRNLSFALTLRVIPHYSCFLTAWQFPSILHSLRCYLRINSTNKYRLSLWLTWSSGRCCCPFWRVGTGWSLRSLPIILDSMIIFSSFVVLLNCLYHNLQVLLFFFNSSLHSPGRWSGAAAWFGPWVATKDQAVTLSPLPWLGWGGELEEKGKIHGLG